ncbi:MAG: polymerase, sigma-24 subunit, subfamily [Planctomycetaceae bacterium]|nr:polymerase, sigma-24 subunit, subfamily [Planctomycetaceae bacterium]
MSDSEVIPFSELLKGAREGRPDAVNDLMSFMRDFVRTKAGTTFPLFLRRRVDASDATQDVALEVIQVLSQFQGTTQAEFENWLRRILTSRILRMIRDNTAVQARSLRREQYPGSNSLLAEVSHSMTPPHVVAERREFVEKLPEIESTLSTRTCQTWIWRSEGMSMAEICNKLQCSPKEVARMLREVRSELKRFGFDPSQ